MGKTENILKINDKLMSDNRELKKQVEQYREKWLLAVDTLISIAREKGEIQKELEALYKKVDL